VPDPTQVGIVEIDDQNRVTRFKEKPTPDEVFGNLSNTGILVVEPHVLDRIPPDVVDDFGRDLLPRLIEEGVPVYGWCLPADTYLIDMGTPEKYALAEATFGQPHLKPDQAGSPTLGATGKRA
ncbi:MAG: NDP-sugar synthase, partial [Thermoflexales bacterium]